VVLLESIQVVNIAVENRHPCRPPIREYPSALAFEGNCGGDLVMSSVVDCRAGLEDA
jgi:hypothetical protein